MEHTTRLERKLKDIQNIIDELVENRTSMAPWAIEGGLERIRELAVAAKWDASKRQ